MPVKFFCARKFRAVVEKCYTIVTVLQRNVEKACNKIWADEKLPHIPVVDVMETILIFDNAEIIQGRDIGIFNGTSPRVT